MAISSGISSGGPFSRKASSQAATVQHCFRHTGLGDKIDHHIPGPEVEHPTAGYARTIHGVLVPAGPTFRTYVVHGGGWGTRSLLWVQLPTGVTHVGDSTATIRYSGHCLQQMERPREQIPFRQEDMVNVLAQMYLHSLSITTSGTRCSSFSIATLKAAPMTVVL